MEHGVFADDVTRAVATVFPHDPPRFLARTPHGYHDTAQIREDLRRAGFTDITIDSIDIRSADGTPFLSSGPIRASYDPRDLLDRRIVVKSLEVTRPNLTLIDYGNDDWNWKRALRRKGVTASNKRSRFGEYIVIDTTTTVATVLQDELENSYTLPH